MTLTPLDNVARVVGLLLRGDRLSTGRSNLSSALFHGKLNEKSQKGSQLKTYSESSRPSSSRDVACSRADHQPSALSRLFVRSVLSYLTSRIYEKMEIVGSEVRTTAPISSTPKRNDERGKGDDEEEGRSCIEMELSRTTARSRSWSRARHRGTGYRAL